MEERRGFRLFRVRSRLGTMDGIRIESGQSEFGVFAEENRRQPEINKRTRHLDDASAVSRGLAIAMAGCHPKIFPLVSEDTCLDCGVWLCSVVASKAKDKQSRRLFRPSSFSLFAPFFISRRACTHECMRDVYDVHGRSRGNLFDDPRRRDREGQTRHSRCQDEFPPSGTWLAIFLRTKT